jgi:hypothetical protein
MIATLSLTGESAEAGGTVVPVSARIRSHHQPNGYAVLVIAQENSHAIAHLKDVHLGPVNGNQVLVHGVSPGERIITTGMDLVRDGEPVRITGATEEGDNGTQE